MSPIANDLTRVTTPVGRISFPKVFKPEAFDGGDPKYSCVLLVKKSVDLTPLKEALRLAKAKQWGDDPKKWPKGLTSPIKDGDEKEDLDGYAGMYAISANNKHRPQVVGPSPELTPIEEASGDFYAGCMGRLALRAFAWDFKNKSGAVMRSGVSFSLEHVQKTGDGEPFSGKVSAEDAFGGDGGATVNDDDSSGDGDDDF